MIRIARPVVLTVPEPKQQARALVGLLGGPTAECCAVELTSDIASVTKEFHLSQAGDYRIVLTQMGNVPVVVSAVRLGPYCLLSGVSIGAEIVISPKQHHLTLILEFKALWWA
jgi:hypothetical protein